MIIPQLIVDIYTNFKHKNVILIATCLALWEQITEMVQLLYRNTSDLHGVRVNRHCRKVTYPVFTTIMYLKSSALTTVNVLKYRTPKFLTK